MTALLTEPLPALEPAPSPVQQAQAPDGRRMLVTRRSADVLEHRALRDLPEVLRQGDVLVVNTSKVMPAALAAWRADGTDVRVHLSTSTPEGWWLVEVRRPDATGTVPFGAAVAGEALRLPAAGWLRLLAPHQPAPISGGVRLWRAAVDLPDDVHAYLQAHGQPIRYRGGDVGHAPPQTIFATVPGSAEPPSAALGFTHELVTGLVSAGVEIVPIVLHCGVSSLEEGEPPHGEWYAVPPPTARRVNDARAAGGRIIAVGTTVTRALETVAGADGTVRPSRGWTEHLVTAATGVRAIDGLLTGWHEPRASHLQLVTAVGGSELVARSYHAAAAAGYHGHEHGDTHLILP